MGVVSFALVIFYQNEVRVKRGLLTIFLNRLGDGAMIFFICLFFVFDNFFFSAELNDNFFLGILMFFIGCFTKRAQFPFIS